MSGSLVTKKALAASIKELMAKKSLAKISIAEIVDNCGLNRQTFYYHFKDKYDLVNWIYSTEVVASTAESWTYEQWSDGIMEILRIMKKNQSFYTNALNSSGQNTFSDYLFSVTREMTLQVFGSLSSKDSIDEEGLMFMAEFITHGLVGIISKWVKSGMPLTPEQLHSRIIHLVDDGIKMVFLSYISKIHL